MIRLNENITKLRWKFDGRLWEETEFWVEIKSLAEPRSRNDLTITASPPNNISAVTGQREYNTTLNIERAMNCTLTVHVLDKNVGTGNYATAWYFFLDNIDWATVKRDMNNTEALISLNVSSFSNLTKNEDVNVIVDESFACTVSTRTFVAIEVLPLYSITKFNVILGEPKWTRGLDEERISGLSITSQRIFVVPCKSSKTSK